MIDTQGYIKEGMLKFHGSDFDAMMDTTLYQYATYFDCLDFLLVPPLDKLKQNDSTCIEFLTLCGNEIRNWERHWKDLKQERRKRKKMEIKLKIKRSINSTIWKQISQLFGKQTL